MDKDSQVTDFSQNNNIFCANARENCCTFNQFVESSLCSSARPTHPEQLTRSFEGATEDNDSVTCLKLDPSLRSSKLFRRVSGDSPVVHFFAHQTNDFTQRRRGGGNGGRPPRGGRPPGGGPNRSKLSSGVPRNWRGMNGNVSVST